ncbi:MAG: class I SAM-dependent methyltransferase [Propionibacteriaceae bacterium]
MDAADFYTGLIADLYAPLKMGSNDPGVYADLLAERGEPALELGCGDGDPMLELLRRGFDVTGVDSSPDMLERFRRAAEREGLAPRLHQQRMEDLDLPLRYRTIFLAGPTFILLPDDATALRALVAIRRHLTPDGTALVPLWVPPPAAPADLGSTKESVAEDGALLRCTTVSQERDEARRTQNTLLRYAWQGAGESASTERVWSLHWHTPDGFADLAERAGLRVESLLGPDGSPAGPKAEEFTVRLRAAG